MTCRRLYVTPEMIKAQQHFDIIVSTILIPTCQVVGRGLKDHEVSMAISAYATNLDLSDDELKNILEIKFNYIIDYSEVTKETADFSEPNNDR